MTTQASTNPTAEFLTYFFTEHVNYYHNIPIAFEEQAKAGHTKFFLQSDPNDAKQTAAFVSAAQYNRMANNDCVRIVIEEPTLIEEGVTFKLRLQCIIEKVSGKFVPFKKGYQGPLPEGQMWVPGFHSDLIHVNQAFVDEGFLTQTDYDAFLAYAQNWQKMLADGNRAPYAKGNNSIRLWLTPANNDFLFNFQMEERWDPTNKCPAVGMTAIEWKNAVLIGKGTRQVGYTPGYATAGEISDHCFEVAARPFVAKTAEVPSRGK